MKISITYFSTSQFVDITLVPIPTASFRIDPQGIKLVEGLNPPDLVFDSKQQMRVKCVSEPAPNWRAISGAQLTKECDDVLKTYGSQIRAMAANVYPKNEVDALIDKKVDDSVASKTFRDQLIKEFTPELVKQVALLVNKEIQERADEKAAQRAADAKKVEDAKKPKAPAGKGPK